MSTAAPSLPVVDLCRELVRIPSCPGQEKAVAECVAERMKTLGMKVEIDPYGDVLGFRQGCEPGPVMILDAHLDTVPVTDPSGWKHDPFGAEVTQGRLWGRGSADTKGSLASMLCAAASLPADAFRGTLVVSASVCEENMTSAAFSHVLDDHPADIVLVGEPTLLKLGTAQKGRAGIVVQAQGRSAHTSRPELGDNAVYKMMEAIARIRSLPLPVDPEMGKGVCELIEIDSEPKLAPGMVPHRSTARFSLRLLPGEDAGTLLERMGGCLDGLEGVSLRLTQLTQTCWTGERLTLDECVPAWRAPGTPLQARLLENLGTTAFAAPYTTNASASAMRGIPTFLLGPGSIEQAHAVDEWIALDQLEAAVDAYRTAIRTCLTRSSS